MTLGTKLIEGPGHAPLSSLAIWKEALMALIFLVAIIELFLNFHTQKNTAFQWIASRLARFRRAKSRSLEESSRLIWNIGLEKTVVILLLLIALILFPLRTDLTTFVYGFKYVFVPLIFCIVLATLPWEEGFLEKKIFPALLIVGGIVSLYGIITFFLPQSFFTSLGYSDAHSLYAPGSSLSAFQQISGTAIRRIQSTFSGPNQFGLWLLLPWSIGIVKLLKRFSSSEELRRSDESRSLSTLLRTSFSTRPSGSLEENIILFLIALALVMTLSRSAWIAAFVITLASIFMIMQGRQRNRLLTGIISVVVVMCALVMFKAPELVLRSISNRHHLERVQEGVRTMVQNPFGLGLGMAGPASNRTSDACIYFEAGADTSWAKDRDDLCLFVNDVQAQPPIEQKECRCPRLPENWYVQIGVELGVLGFALFIALTFLLLKRLHANEKSLFLAFLGVSIAALFLHAWEDSAVAYTMWGLVGISLSRKNATH